MAKRVLTAEIYASSVASNIPSTLSAATPPDLAAQLRAIGMRTRKHVMEGYATNRDPNHYASSRMKALSTGSIFRSPQDPTSASKYSRPSRKRRRSEDDLADIDDSENSQPSQVDIDSMLLDHKDSTERPVKPLRKPGQALAQSRSLPAGTLFSDQLQSSVDDQDNIADSEKDLLAEEDWSESNFNASFRESSFEPMTL